MTAQEARDATDAMLEFAIRRCRCNPAAACVLLATCAGVIASTGDKPQEALELALQALRDAHAEASDPSRDPAQA